MICSPAELGLSGDADGILVLPPDAASAPTSSSSCSCVTRC
jgi:tRNA-binding EMAP/Myf-like protein